MSSVALHFAPLVHSPGSLVELFKVCPGGSQFTPSSAQLSQKQSNIWGPQTVGSAGQCNLAEECRPGHFYVVNYKTTTL